MDKPGLVAIAHVAARHLNDSFPDDKTGDNSLWITDELRNKTSQLIADLGSEATWREVNAELLPTLALPMVLVLSHINSADTNHINNSQHPKLNNDNTVVIYDYHADHWQAVGYPSENQLKINLATLQRLPVSNVLVITPVASADTRGDYLAPSNVKHWFWPEIWRHKQVLLSSILFSIAINVLTLATTLFTMSVYDRVIPNQAYVTLWSLAAGVLLAVIFEQIAKQVRASALDTMGQQVDIILSQRLFLTAMRSKLEARQNAIGTTVSMLREFDAVREFVASATLSLLADLPFVILFLFIISLIAGVLVWVPLVAVLLTIVICLIAQIPLAKLSQESLRESATRQGITVEALENTETLRANHAEKFMLSKFNRVSQLTAQLSLRMRSINQHMTSMTTLIQQLVTIGVIVWGAYLIGDAHLTTGALFATVILSARVIGPLHAVGALAMRLQHTRSALRSLNLLMQSPQTTSNQGITKLYWGKSLSMQGVTFSYPSTESVTNLPVLKNINIQIEAGEMIAVLGRVGSGKTTLLKLLAGLYMADSGQIRLDNVALPHIDEAQLRQTITYVPQEAHLFIGTLRDNLLLGAKGVSDEYILSLAQSFALMPLISQHPMGLDMPVAEGGANFSLGQRELISLVRALLRRSKFLLLDEPSASMDLQLERTILNSLKVFANQTGTCLIIVTHRPAVVDIVNRLIVIDQATIVADGPKLAVLKMLDQTNELKKTSTESSPTYTAVA